MTISRCSFSRSRGNSRATSGSPCLQALYDAHWKLKWGIEPSTAWRDLALLLLEKGRLTEAVEVAGHVTDTYALIAMRADRRFDPVAAAAPSQFDIPAAAERELRGLQAMADATPNSLELQSHTIEALGNQLHYGAMLAAADAVVLEATSTNYPDKLYQDYDDQYQWILSDRAAALERFGEWDEAVDVLTNSSKLIGADAGQPLDLASLYCDLGRPKEALSALEQIAADPNAFGGMQVELVRLDAATQLGDAKQAARSLQYLAAHRSDSLSTYQSALVLVNQLDKAAELLVTRLHDPSDRLDALETIQTYVEPPATPRRMELDARWQAVIAARGAVGQQSGTYRQLPPRATGYFRLTALRATTRISARRGRFAACAASYAILGAERLFGSSQPRRTLFSGNVDPKRVSASTAKRTVMRTVTSSVCLSRGCDYA
jgi:tetratricopeptide (TPR) repeat protein